jgi:hypothetical protein
MSIPATFTLDHTFLTFGDSVLDVTLTTEPVLTRLAPGGSTTGLRLNRTPPSAGRVTLVGAGALTGEFSGTAVLVNFSGTLDQFPP